MRCGVAAGEDIAMDLDEVRGSGPGCSTGLSGRGYRYGFRGGEGGEVM